MKKSVLARFAASGLILAVTAIGCKPATDARPMAASSSTPKAAKGAAKAAARAETALRKRKPAVTDAEAAVTLAPQDARYRQLLGQAYLAAGRFVSAETSFADAVALDPEAGRAWLSLALSQIATGRAAAARETLAAAAGKIGEADRGLALALAADAPGAVRVLEAAARAPDADAKTRQNLALAYAMAGEWARAQATAAQDLSPADVDARLRDWAKFARPGTGAAQVAALLKVSPVADPGQPTRLALVAPAETQVADAALPVEVAAAEPQPVAEVPIAAAPVFYAAPAADRDAAPLIRAPKMTARVAVADAARAAPMIAARRATWTPPRQGNGDWVVQLGAFSRATPVDAAWAKVTGRVGLLNAYAPSQSRFTLASATLTRLTLNGFASRDDAMRVCTRIRAAGGPCFVRPAAGEAPVRMAARKRGVQVASR